MRPGRELLTHCFSCSSGPAVDPIKCAAGHVTPNLCFCILCDLVSGTAFWSIRSMKHRCTIFHAPMDSMQIPQKAYRDTLHRTCIFASGVIYVSRSSYWWVRVTKRRCTIFMLGWAWCGLQKKHSGTHRTCVFCSRWDLRVT
jgi:hypothetical protein